MLAQQAYQGALSKVFGYFVVVVLNSNISNTGFFQVQHLELKKKDSISIKFPCLLIYIVQSGIQIFVILF